MPTLFVFLFKISFSLSLAGTRNSYTTKWCHLYSKMLKAVSQNPIKIQRKATRSTGELVLDSLGTLGITTRRHLILNSNKLNPQHCFKRNFIRPRQNYFSHWTRVFTELWGESSFGTGGAGQEQQSSQGGTLLPFPSPVQPSPSQRESKHILSPLRQCSSLHDKGGNPQALPVKFSFIPQKAFKELLYSQLSKHDSKEACTQINSWPAP